MFQVLLHRLVPAALAVISGAAPANPASPTRADPLDAGASTPAVQYRSPLADYRRHAEQPLGSWRQANETVTRIGGWRAYAREAAQTGAAPAPAPDAPAKPSGDAGHKN